MNYYDDNVDLELTKEVQDKVIKRIAKDRIRDLLRFREEFEDKVEGLLNENGVISSEEDILAFRKLECEYMKIIFWILGENKSDIKYLIDNE